MTDTTGAVIGVIARGQGKEVAIRARKGVILACGGFEQSVEMGKRFQGDRYVSMCHPSNTGDGNRMAQKVGAGLWHMWHIHGARFIFPELGDIAIRHDQGNGTTGRYGQETKMVWIAVNKHGRRYMNEYPADACGSRPSAHGAYSTATCSSAPLQGGRERYAAIPSLANLR